MKRLISLLLALTMCFSLASCSGSASEKNPASSTVAVETNEILNEQAGAEAYDYTAVNPLTGEAVDEDISANRPIAVMLNNIRQALPQSGNAQADILYEIPEEGGITRIMALYQDISDVGYLGSIRSTRPYYVQLAVAADSILVHAGGSGKAYRTIQKYMEKSDFTDLDFLSKGTRTANIFWREQSRFDAGYASEHTLFTSSDKIQEYLEANAEEIRLTHKDNFQYVHTFAEDGTPENGADATSINVSMSGYKSTGFDYDAESNTYKVSQFGSSYMDQASGEQVAVTNVIVILTDVTELHDAKNHVDVAITGRGSGYYFNGGKYEKIVWSKADVRNTYTFYREDGETTFDLGVGKTFVCLCDKSRDITVNDVVLEKPSNADSSKSADLDAMPVDDEEEA